MKSIFKILFTLLIICHISTCFLIKRDTPISQPFCFHSVCGWQIDKQSGLIEYVENNCKCKPDEQCLRTAKEYRLPGYKYHCRKSEEAKETLDPIIQFPPPNRLKSHQSSSDD